MAHRCLVWTLSLMAALASPAAAQDVSPATSSAHAPDVVRAIELRASRVQRLLAQARTGGDPRRTRCVDAQLSQLGATLRLGLERQSRAARLEARGEHTMAERERALLARLVERARELEREARLCVDPDALEPNRTRVTVIIEPDVPSDAVLEPIADRRRF